MNSTAQLIYVVVYDFATNEWVASLDLGNKALIARAPSATTAIYNLEESVNAELVKSANPAIA